MSRGTLPKRGVYLVGELTAGGYQRQLFYLLKGIDRGLIEPHLVVWNFDPRQRFYNDFNELGIPIHAVRRKRGRWGRVRSLYSIIRSIAPDFIHSYCFYMNFPAWVVGKFCGIEALGAFRSDFINERKVVGPIWGRLCSVLPKCSIVNSQAAGQSINQARTFFKPARVWCIGNAVEMNSFSLSAVAKNIHQVRLLGVGRLAAEKRWDLLIDAVSDLHSEGFRNFHLTICGEGETRSDLQAQINCAGLGENVLLAGYCGQLKTYYESSDVLLLCSDREGSPNSVLEAMSYGIPVISTKVGDVPLFVDDGKTGFLIPRGDREALKNILRIVFQNPNILRPMGERSREKIGRQSSIESLVGNTLQVYREMNWI